MRWASSGGVGILVDMALVVLITAFGIALGGLLAGGDLATPVAGTAVLFLYGAAMIGIGVAVGGVLGTRLAAPIVAVVVLVTWLVQTTWAALQACPTSIQQLALTNHYGQPLSASGTGVASSSRS